MSAPAGMQPPVVDFYFGLGSRYSYLASSQVAVISAETGAAFNWLPVDSTKLIGARGENPFQRRHLTGPYDWEYRRRDAEAWAEHYGVPFREPHGRLQLDPDLLSRACVLARCLGAVEPYAKALFSAIFTEDLLQIDRTSCVDLADRVGLSRSGFEADLDREAVRTEQNRILQQAIVQGAFGVPTFVVASRLFWGNDRLVLLRHHLDRLRDPASGGDSSESRT